jgi:hypothetical protein
MTDHDGILLRTSKRWWTSSAILLGPRCNEIAKVFSLNESRTPTGASNA